MVNRIKSNISTIIKYSLVYWGSLSAFAGVFLSFITWEDMGITRKSNRILILLGIALIAVIIAIAIVFCRKQKRIFGDINKGVIICYGDLIDIGFPTTNESKKIVVIPVNRCFDFSCENNLISRKSIHGQWVEHYIRSEQEVLQINQKVHQSLSMCGAKFDVLTRENKKVGNLERYQPGTIVELPGQNGIIFYLLALSELNEDLKAHCSETDFYEVIQGLLKYYDAHGQGEDLYCPVMGDHIVRPTRETGDIINLMLSHFRFNRGQIHGNIHLVVYEKMKTDISILQY